MSATDEVLIRREGVAGIFSLNRPQAIHALTLDMCRRMTAAMLEWRDDDGVQAVMIDHAEGRGFCSGGDIALLRHSLAHDQGVTGKEFFRDEYRLNHLMFTYAKPFVSFMDGITMGGGVGVSQPARFRVVTENTRYAMPETGIGLFPDVGGSWYLPRLKGRLGQFIGLTGARLDGSECLWTGLGTHYLSAATLPEAKERIAAGEEVATVLDALSVAPPAPRLAAYAEEIARHFASDDLETIIASLEADGSEWASAQLATLKSKSPLCSKITLRLMAQGAQLSTFAEVMAMEYRVAPRLLVAPDFAEGVRAVIVDKDNAPRWSPATADDVRQADLDALMAPWPDGVEWTPLAGAEQGSGATS